MLRLTILAFALALSACRADAQPNPLAVGDRAPAFTAVDDAGKPWSSADVVGRKVLVVYFYPAAMTGGCTKQACAFRDHHSRLGELGAEVVGISGDPAANLRVFRKTHRLNFPLLSDPEGAVARRFGVPVGKGGTFTTEVDGKQVTLDRSVTTARWTFVIDRDGRIVYRNTEVNPERDSAEVLDVLARLDAAGR